MWGIFCFCSFLVLKKTPLVHYKSHATCSVLGTFNGPGPYVAGIDPTTDRLYPTRCTYTPSILDTGPRHRTILSGCRAKLRGHISTRITWPSSMHPSWICSFCPSRPMTASAHQPSEGKVVLRPPLCRLDATKARHQALLHSPANLITMVSVSNSLKAKSKLLHWLVRCLYMASSAYPR